MTRTTHPATSATAALSMALATIAAFALPARAQVDCSNPPDVAEHHHLPANADTVHWGYFSKNLPKVVAHSGDLVTMSVAADFGITQVVDGNWGVHGVIEKRMFSPE